MAFFGCQFSFDGIPSFEYGLMVYDIGGSNEDGTFSSPVEIHEDRTSKRYTPLFYGTAQNTPLTFNFTFGADLKAIDTNSHLDRWDMDVISKWLTGHDGYKYLEITQPDMESVRYKCIISNLEYTTYGKIPWAFSCQVTCDSPFAYLYPEVLDISVAGNVNAAMECRAASRYYFPKITINMKSGTTFSIINHSDNDRVFKFEGLSTSTKTIIVDNENEVIVTNPDDNAIYNKFNFNFLRLVRGYNHLEFSGNAEVSFECEYPINIGG